MVEMPLNYLTVGSVGMLLGGLVMWVIGTIVRTHRSVSVKPRTDNVVSLTLVNKEPSVPKQDLQRLSLYVYGSGDVELANSEWVNLTHARVDEVMSCLNDETHDKGYLAHYRAHLQNFIKADKHLTIVYSNGACAVIRMTEITRIKVFITPMS